MRLIVTLHFCYAVNPIIVMIEMLGGFLLTCNTVSWTASVALVMTYHNLFPLTEVLPSIMTDLTPHLSLTVRHMSVTPPSITSPPC